MGSHVVIKVKVIKVKKQFNIYNNKYIYYYIYCPIF